MKMIAPTYLRTIHDGLLSGTIHKDNASALPNGLVGMYEEALPPAANVNERKRFLEFFAVWALLKKEVSIAFVVPLLEGWTEEHVLDYISRYSKWFNSPVSGKYVLYHERIRSFLLQKVSHGHFTACNESIIQNCQNALQAKSDNEWEYYGLEHLSIHMLIQAMESKNAAALKALAYDTAHWNRQVEISKCFEWSKRMLNEMMLWASKYDDDEVIECSLNKVDLRHQEQNDAPRIVELVAQNDIETALQRIETFGGNDKEGLQRKFILYMLCLMELTLLDSKDKPFRKEAIEQLLKHLDDNLPIDHSVLNWNDFFPSYLISRIVTEWKDIFGGFKIIYKRTSAWNQNEQENNIVNIEKNIRQKNLIDEWNADLFNESFSLNRGWSIAQDEDFKSEKKIESQLENNDLQTAFKIALDINNLYLRIKYIKKIISQFVATNNYLEARNILLYLIKYSQGFQFSDREEIISKVLDSYCNLGLLNESHISIARTTKVIKHYMILAKSLSQNLYSNHLNKIEDEAMSIALNIDFEIDKREALIMISRYKALMGNFDDAIKTAEIIDDYRDRKQAFDNITQILRNNSKNNHAIALEVYYEFTYRKINCSIDEFKSDEFTSILEKAIYVADNVPNISDRIYAYMVISRNYIKHNDLPNGEKILEIIFKLITQTVFDKIELKDYLLRELSVLYSTIIIIEKALECARGIIDESKKSHALHSITGELAKQGMIEEALECARGISSDSYKNDALKDISTELAKQGRLEEAIECARGIIDESEKSHALHSISGELAKQGMIEEALECARGISSDSYKNDALKDISTELSKQGNWSLAESTGLEIIQIAKRYSCWREIARNTFEEKGWKNALQVANQFVNVEVKTQYLKVIADCTTPIETGGKEQILDAIIYYENDIESLEKILQQHALHELFFSNAAFEKIERFNRTLNIQWAIDIKNSFSGN